MKVGDRVIVKNININSGYVTFVKGTVLKIQDPELEPKWGTHKTIIEFDEPVYDQIEVYHEQKRSGKIGDWVTDKIQSYETYDLEKYVEIDIKETRNHKLKDLGIL